MVGGEACGKGTMVDVRLKLALIDTGEPGNDVDLIAGCVVTAVVFDGIARETELCEVPTGSTLSVVKPDSPP